MILNTSTGNVGIGIDNPRGKLDIYNGNLVVRATNEDGSAILYLKTPYVSDSALKCALIAEGISNYSRSKFHFCFDDTANNSATYNASLSNSRMTRTQAGRNGVANTNPQSMLHLGNCEVLNSAPVIVFGKNVNGTGFRNAFMGYTDNFFFVIGDYGNTNAGSNALTSQLAVIYNAPASSFVIKTSGYVRMAYGFGNGSDERIKSNIKTIENAFDKTLLLRCVEFNSTIENRMVAFPTWLQISWGMDHSCEHPSKTMSP
jgi:hypothetical protein